MSADHFYIATWFCTLRRPTRSPRREPLLSICWDRLLVGNGSLLWFNSWIWWPSPVLLRSKRDLSPTVKPAPNSKRRPFVIPLDILNLRSLRLCGCPPFMPAEEETSFVYMLTVTCKTVGYSKISHLNMNLEHTTRFGGRGGVGGIGLESEERGGENRRPATHFSRNWAANLVVWRFAPRNTLAYPMVGIWSRSTAECRVSLRFCM